MMRTPSRRQIEALRYLAVGMAIGPADPQGKWYPVVAKGVCVIVLQGVTVARLQDAGWLDADRRLTPLGRDVAEVKSFVRAFAQGARA